MKRLSRAHWALKIGIGGVALAVSGTLLSPPAGAAPTHTTPTAVGAVPVDSSVSSPPDENFLAAPKQSGSCAFPNVAPPAGLVIKHVAPCGSTSGNGSATNPWRNLAQAMAALQPNEVAYIHDDPTLAVDYAESNLTPARGGTGVSARIRLMAAPGERPTIARSTSASTNSPMFMLNQPWWIIDGRNFTNGAAGMDINGSGLALGASVIRVTSTNAHHIVLRRLDIHDAGGTKSMINIDNGPSNIAILDGKLRETVDTVTGRPAFDPTGSNTDHHGVSVNFNVNKVLVRGVDSSGHNGDSFQCGEETDTSQVIPTDITLENNRFHQDEENAIDIKACRGLTIRGNKAFGYRPARGLAGRAPHGDAVIVQWAPDTQRPSDRVLLEKNRLFDNSRAINLHSSVDKVVVRRNLIFDSSTAFCGMGAGITIASKNAEVYHNTLSNLVASTNPGGCTSWGTSQTAALWLTPTTTTSKVVLWNNIIDDATNPYRRTATAFILDSTRNLFSANFTSPTPPPGSLFGDPLFVADPANNDYYTQMGSPARDRAMAVPASVGDPAVYCDDQSPGETDAVAQPDIGFLESGC